MRWRYALPLAVLLVLAGFFYFGLYNKPGEIPSPLIGKPAPAFTLPDVRDPQRTVSNAAYGGRPYVVNVWATWCFGCRAEHDVLLDIARSGLVPIVGLNWKDDRALAIGWLKQLGDPYENVAFDAEGRVAIDWGVYGAPETFLVGADGRILYKHIGPLTPGIWEREFLPLIRGSRGEQS